MHNTIGLYYEKEPDIKISNSHWNLIVYKDLNLIKNVFENAKRTLQLLEQHVFHLDAKFNNNLQNFLIPLKPHYTMLKSIAKTISEKLDNLGLSTSRKKRFIIDAAGSLIKWITGNLDANDGKYFNDAINKLERDDSMTQTLMKQQIAITTKVIKNFNSTIQKLLLDDNYLENNLKTVQTFINNNEERDRYLTRQLAILSSCENLLETFMLLNNELTDIETSLTFAKLKILHNSIISPFHLLEQLINISKLVSANEALPLTPNIHNINQIANLITIRGFSTTNRVVYILNIPLTNNEIYTTYHLFSTPIRHASSHLFHTFIPQSKYVGLSHDNRQYIRLDDISTCKNTEDNLICFNILPNPGESPPCEINIISKLQSENCQPTVMALNEYNVQPLKKNKWLIIITEPIPVKTSCGNQIDTKMIYENSILRLTPNCKAFIGSIQLTATDRNSTTKEDDIIPIIPFSCCDEINEKTDKMKLKPIPIRNIKLDEFHNLEMNINEFKEDLYNVKHDAFPYKKYAFSTIISIISLILLFLCYCCKCHKKAWRMIRRNDDDRRSYCPQIFNQCSFDKNPQRTTTYRNTEIADGERLSLTNTTVPENRTTSIELQAKPRRVVL